MKEIKASFSTELYGYDNDALSGIVIQNTFSLLNNLASYYLYTDTYDDLGSLSEEEQIEKVNSETKLLKERIAFSEAIKIEVFDTGKISDTVDIEGFAPHEEYEYKIQDVIVSFGSDYSFEECEHRLREILELTTIKLENEKEKDPADPFCKASMHLITQDLKIIESLIDTLA